MNGEAALLLPREGTFAPIMTGMIQPCKDGDERLSSQRGELPQRLWDRDKPPVSKDQKNLCERRASSEEESGSCREAGKGQIVESLTG